MSGFGPPPLHEATVKGQRDGGGGPNLGLGWEEQRPVVRPSSPPGNGPGGLAFRHFQTKARFSLGPDAFQPSSHHRLHPPPGPGYWLIVARTGTSIVSTAGRGGAIGPAVCEQETHGFRYGRMGGERGYHRTGGTAVPNQSLQTGHQSSCGAHLHRICIRIWRGQDDSDRC